MKLTFTLCLLLAEVIKKKRAPGFLLTLLLRFGGAGMLTGRLDSMRKRRSEKLASCDFSFAVWEEGEFPEKCALTIHPSLETATPFIWVG